MASRDYKRDLRWPSSLALTAAGVAIALVTRSLHDDSWEEFGVFAVYSVAWALITFAVLYPVTKVFEDWEWGRENHDLKKIVEQAGE